MTIFMILSLAPAAAVCAAEPPDFAKDVQPLLTKYCAGCHSPDDVNGEFMLHDFASLMKGGENGPVLVPGKLEESRIVGMVERTAEPVMPPEDEPAPTADEIAILKAWIAAGAKGPTGHGVPMLDVPEILPTGPIRRPVHAAAWSPDGETLAVGRYGSVELRSQDLKLRETLEGFSGKVNVLAFLPDGRLLAAGGEAGLAGEVGVWDVATRQPLWKKAAHRDAITSGTVSRDGRLIATGSYDQSIMLWDAATGEAKATLTGHNGPVFGLAFHPTKPILASASGDRTIKLWDTGAAERLDTLIEPTKEQSAIAFSPDGSRLAAGGADNRVRVWSVRDGAAGTTPILFSQFAHEGPIVALAYTGDGRVLVTASQDKTVKVWNAATLTQVTAPTTQSDWVAVLAVAPGGERVALGRLDGSVDALPLPIASPAGTSPSAQREPAVAAKPAVAPATQPMPSAVAEVEPNDTFATATPLSLPGIVSGVLAAGTDESDADCYRFTAAAGESWIFETDAARSKSPADTKIDVLHPDGTPVERLRLRAVRDSAINFRGFSSVNPGLRVDYWEEMELNEYMYLSGEVCRIYRMPQGPDSDMQLYSIDKQRRSYFDTTPVAHALFEAVYIVEPHPPGTALPANGLPVFSLPYENDDDAERKLGRDSKLTFTAPADGDYVVRVRDARGFGGDDHKYTLTARRPKPDFAVSIAEKERTVPVGSGQRLTLKVDRIDGFDGPVHVNFGHLPAGLTVSAPVVVEAGHVEGEVVLNAAAEAKTPSEDEGKPVQVTATASVEGRLVTHPVAPPGKLAVGEKPKVLVTLTPEGGDEIEIRPGESVTAMLSIERDGFDGELKFDIDNLPHGVIVDNIGLSGVLVRKGENQRQIVLSCAKWVPATSRRIFAVAKGQGDQASRPITLRVVRDDELARAGE
ncbi:MAG: c-type cytochrome domain-containing protein [Planctomycetaceae bacterium]